MAIREKSGDFSKSVIQSRPTEREARCESFGSEMMEELIAGTDFQLSCKAAINPLAGPNQALIVSFLIRRAGTVKVV